jgi:hypothetical protein
MPLLADSLQSVVRIQLYRQPTLTLIIANAAFAEIRQCLLSGSPIHDFCGRPTAFRGGLLRALALSGQVRTAVTHLNHRCAESRHSFLKLDVLTSCASMRWELSRKNVAQFSNAAR